MAKKKKNSRNWHRKHEISYHKPTNSTKGHPSYIVGSSGRLNRFFCFTHSETTNGEKNIKLKHNIAPDETGDTYVRPKRQTDIQDNFEPPKKKYRIHEDDMPLMQSLRDQK